MRFRRHLPAEVAVRHALGVVQAAVVLVGPRGSLGCQRPSLLMAPEHSQVRTRVQTNMPRILDSDQRPR